MPGFTASGPASRMGASDQVIAYIQQGVRSGKYHVGDRLPNEADLAAMIGVGRSSLREGMRILAAYGIVEIRQGEGTFIIDKTAENFFDVLGYIPDTNIWSFLELRRVLEIGAVMTVCSALTPAQLDHLQKLVDQLVYQNGLDVCVQMDREFHKTLLLATGNPLLEQIEKMIYGMRSELLYKIFCYPDIVERAHEAHQKILDALRNHNPEVALQAVKAHLDEVTSNINRLNLGISSSGGV